MARANDLALLDVGCRERLPVVGAAVLHGIELVAAARDDHRVAIDLGAEGTILAHLIARPPIDPCPRHVRTCRSGGAPPRSSSIGSRADRTPVRPWLR